MEKLFHIELEGLEWQGRCLRCCRTERNSFLPDIIKSSQRHSTLEHDDEPLVCELFVKAKELVALAGAPNGYIWKWETPELAHLVDLSNSRGWKAVCGEKALGVHLGFLIGGYSARPCQECLEKVSGGSSSNGGTNV